MIRLITLNSAAEAHLICGRLENYGIVSMITNENFSNLLPMYNGMMGSGVQILVKEEDFEKAYEILQKDLKPPMEKPICPFCHSKNVKLGIGKQKSAKIFNILLSLFLVIPFGNQKPKYFCSDCKEEFD